MADYELLDQKQTLFGTKRRNSEETTESNQQTLDARENDEGFLFRLTEAATKSMIIRRDESTSRQNSAQTSKKNSVGTAYQPITIPPSKAISHSATNITTVDTNDNNANNTNNQTSIKSIDQELKATTTAKLSKEQWDKQKPRRYSSNADENPHLIASNLVEFSGRSHAKLTGNYNENNNQGFISSAQCYIGCYYLLRIFSVLLAFFLCIIAVNYGLGQLISLEAIDLFCPTYTQDEVFKHNRNVNSSRGVGGCYKIDDAPLDSDSLFNDSFTAYWDVELGSKLLCSIFLLMAAYFVLIGVYFGYNTCIDIYYQFINTNDPNPRLMTNLNAATLQRLQSSEMDDDHDNSSDGTEDDHKDDENNTNNTHKTDKDGNKTRGSFDGSVESMGVELTTLTASYESEQVMNITGKRRAKKSLFERAETLWIDYEGSLYNIIYSLCGCRQCSNFCKHFCCCDLFNVCGSKIVDCYRKVDRTSFYLLYPDSKLKIYLHLWEDTFDTAIQTWTLFVYAGINVFALFGDFTLAVYPWYVKYYSIIVGLNCAFSGILWILYVSKHNWCHGQRYVSIVFVFDSLGDLMYALFPLTLYSKHNSLFDAILFDSQALGHLHSENTALFLGVLFAMLFMCRKVYTILRAFDPLYIEYRKLQYLTLNVKLRPYLRHRHSPRTKYIRRKRQVCLLSLGILYLAMGVTIITFFLTYIHQASNFCRNPNETVLNTHPELKYWANSCQYKVFELHSTVSADSCECRWMKWGIDATDYTERGFDYSHISTMMHEWRMLTQLQIEISDDSDTRDAAATAEANSNGTFQSRINLTDYHFVSRKLKILIFDQVSVTSIDNKIKDLHELEIFSVTNHECSDLPYSALGTLSNLKLFDVSDAISLVTIADDICNWKSLRYLSFDTTNIPYIPTCISNLKKLRRIDVSGIASLTTLPKEMFQLPQIIDVIGVYTSVQNITFTTGDSWSSELKRVFLQQSYGTTNPLCDNLDSGTLSNETIKFINAFAACDRPCDGYGCTTYTWGDGVCDSPCFSESCGFDNGDCNQLCECDYDKWGDGTCDKDCNNYNCDYDFGDCLNLNSSGDDYCYGTNASLTEYGCPINWESDTWCDSYCKTDGYHNGQCIGESDDCRECNSDTGGGCYNAWYLTYSVGASDTSLNYFDLEIVCEKWDYLSKFFTNFNNCTQFFTDADLNQDGRVSFHESLIETRQFFELSYVKAYQINCSLCLPDPSLYY